jgi:hypothetical protein
MSKDGASIADIVFQRSRSQQLVAEIAFAPALAFGVNQTSPTGIQGAILSWVMAALIGIPILRYLVFTDRIKSFDRLLNLTVRPVELSAMLGVAQIFKFLAVEIFSPISALTKIEATAVVSVIAVIFYILVFELIFQKYRFSWGSLFYAKRLELENRTNIQMDDIGEVREAISQHTSQLSQLRAAFGLLKLTLIRITFGQASFYLLKNSIPERDDKAIDPLRNYVEINSQANGLSSSMGVWLAFGVAAVVTIPLFVVIAWLISLLFNTFGAILLVLIIMRLTKHIVALSYISFGTMDYEQFVTSNGQWFVMTTIYTLALYLIIFYPI